MKEKIKPLLPYIIIIAVVLFIKAFIVTPIKVNGESMYPTLEEGDIMILNKTAYYFNKPKRFDIVVVDMPDEYLIKRVIGLPGDDIDIIDNQLYINGEVYKEDYLDDDLNYDDFSLQDLGYATIPEDYYLVLGDNREDSIDSREIGLISKDEIKKKDICEIVTDNLKTYRTKEKCKYSELEDIIEEFKEDKKEE